MINFASKYRKKGLIEYRTKQLKVIPEFPSKCGRQMTTERHVLRIKKVFYGHNKQRDDGITSDIN